MDIARADKVVSTILLLAWLVLATDSGSHSSKINFSRSGYSQHVLFAMGDRMYIPQSHWNKVECCENHMTLYLIKDGFPPSNAVFASYFLFQNYLWPYSIYKQKTHCLCCSRSCLLSNTRGMGGGSGLGCLRSIVSGFLSLLSALLNIYFELKLISPYLFMLQEIRISNLNFMFPVLLC